jgi:hypothetical protein
VDPWGLWDERVHYTKTIEFAVSVGISPSNAKVIAYANNATDGGSLGTGFVGFLPILGDQSRHFNQSKSACDSRAIWAKRQFKAAVSLYQDGKITMAYIALGRGLHSIQDKYAHRDWDTGLLGVNIHPMWYDDVNDPRNRQELSDTRNESISYINRFNKAVVQ